MLPRLESALTRWKVHWGEGEWQENDWNRNPIFHPLLDGCASLNRFRRCWWVVPRCRQSRSITVMQGCQKPNLLLRVVIRIQRWQQKIHLGKSSMLWSLRLYFEYTIVSSERSSCSYAPLLVQLTTKPACRQLFGIFSQTTSQLAQVPQQTNKQTNCTLHCMLHCNAVTACNTAHLKQKKTLSEHIPVPWTC